MDFMSANFIPFELVFPCSRDDLMEFLHCSRIWPEFSLVEINDNPRIFLRLINEIRVDIYCFLNLPVKLFNVAIR